MPAQWLRSEHSALVSSDRNAGDIRAIVRRVNRGTTETECVSCRRAGLVDLKQVEVQFLRGVLRKAGTCVVCCQVFAKGGDGSGAVSAACAVGDN